MVFRDLRVLLLGNCLALLLWYQATFLTNYILRNINLNLLTNFFLYISAVWYVWAAIGRKERVHVGFFFLAGVSSDGTTLGLGNLLAVRRAIGWNTIFSLDLFLDDFAIFYGHIVTVLSEIGVQIYYFLDFFRP